MQLGYVSTLAKRSMKKPLFVVASLVLSSLISLSECRAEENAISIPKSFTKLKLSKGNIASEIANCLPGMNQEFVTKSDTVKDFPQPHAVIRIESANDGYFHILNTSGYCVQKSANGHPILPTEAFYKTVNPLGKLSSTLTEQWYEEIARLIAQKGHARVAFVFSNGNATIADYKIEKENPDILVYSENFKKSGEWESGNFDAKFSNKGLEQISVTKYNDKSEKPYIRIKDASK